MQPTVVPRSGSTIARLRPKNQLTLPEAALAELGVEVGARFLVSVVDGALRLEPIQASYAGALADAYPADWADRLRRERAAWDR